MIGLCGPHRVGKSSLAKAFAEMAGMLYVETSISEVFQKMGLDPRAEYPIEQRLMIQEVILGALCLQYRKARAVSKVFIADRTPIDMASYMLADVARSTVADQPGVAKLVNAYVDRCFAATVEHFAVVVQIQPGIKVVDAPGKAPPCPAYIEHLNALQLGLLADERNKVVRFAMPRVVLTMDDRVSALGNAVGSAVEAAHAIKKHCTVH